MQRTVFDNVLSYAQSNTLEFSYIDKSDFYISFYNTDKEQENMLNYMNTYIKKNIDWIRERLIPIQ